jgi:uncharacterized membrane protein
MKSHTFLKENPKTPESKQSPLFNLAIIIMGTVSCYTTAMGLEPMLGNRVFSIAVATALSLIMVAIALQLPKAYQEHRQAGMILSYVFVASFSVLLNYNFIFGKFSSEKILYKELESHKTALNDLLQKGESSARTYYQLEQLKVAAIEKRGIANEEFQNKVNPGKGKIHRKKDQMARLAENQLKTQTENFQTFMQPIHHDLDSVLEASTAALNDMDWSAYVATIPLLTATYNKLGSRFKSQFSDFSFTPRRFENRDIGQLSHSLGSIFSNQKNGEDPFAVAVALILAILIDFIILFAIIVLNRPAAMVKKNKKAFQGFVASKKITEEPLVLERI